MASIQAPSELPPPGATGLVHQVVTGPLGGLARARAELTGEAQELETRRRGRGRTSALRLVSLPTLLSQMNKRGAIPGFRGALELARSQAGAPLSPEALTELSGKVLERMEETMKGAKIPKTEAAVQALRGSGLDRVLTRALVDGKLQVADVRSEEGRFSRALAGRTLSAEAIKQGIVALDEALLRFGIAAGKKDFDYPYADNKARDVLVTYARSLHR